MILVMCSYFVAKNRMSFTDADAIWSQVIGVGPIAVTKKLVVHENRTVLLTHFSLEEENTLKACGTESKDYFSMGQSWVTCHIAGLRIPYLL